MTKYPPNSNTLSSGVTSLFTFYVTEIQRKALLFELYIQSIRLGWGGQTWAITKHRISIWGKGFYQLHPQFCSAGNSLTQQSLGSGLFCHFNHLFSDFCLIFYHFSSHFLWCPFLVSWLRTTLLSSPFTSFTLHLCAEAVWVPKVTCSI